MEHLDSAEKGWKGQVLCCSLHSAPGMLAFLFLNISGMFPPQRLCNKYSSAWKALYLCSTGFFLLILIFAQMFKNFLDALPLSFYFLKLQISPTLGTLYSYFFSYSTFLKKLFDIVYVLLMYCFFSLKQKLLWGQELLHQCILSTMVPDTNHPMHIWLGFICCAAE